MKYFIVVNEVQQGPFTLEELRQRGITSDLLVWTEGMTDWAPAWQVDELKPLLYGPSNTGTAASTSRPTPPPPPPPHVMEEQPQPTQQPAAPVPPKKRNHAGLWLGIIAALILLLLAITNPSKDEHERVIMDKVTTVLQEKAGGDNSLFGVIGGMLAQMSLQPMLDDALTYHNYLLFSTTTVNLGAKEKKASIGILGKVFTGDEDQIAAAFDNVLHVHSDQSTAVDPALDPSAGNDDATSDDATASDPSAAVEDTTSFGSALARGILHEVSKQVKDEVKKQIRQQTDSATSDHVQGLIDKAFDLIKGL